MYGYEIVNGSPGECISSQDGGCDGEVALHESSTGASASFRCDRHQRAHVERLRPILEENARNYPDSDIPPAWFDATFAGESWNEPE